jgi:uncharacterized protein with NAD-binding domain and iron-sulfur cluster
MSITSLNRFQYLRRASVSNLLRFTFCRCQNRLSVFKREADKNRRGLSAPSFWSLTKHSLRIQNTMPLFNMHIHQKFASNKNPFYKDKLHSFLNKSEQQKNNTIES